MNVYMLLDRSGSMTSLWDEAIGSINGYVSALEDPDTQVYLAVFDSLSYDVLRECKAMDWDAVLPSEVAPRGGTPLLAAATKIITLAQEANADRTIIVIMTDGCENCSVGVTTDTVATKIKSAEDKGWEVVFLGANFSRVTDSAATFGGDFNKTVNFAKGSMLQGMLDLSAKSCAYAATGVSINYSAEERSIWGNAQ